MKLFSTPVDISQINRNPAASSSTITTAEIFRTLSSIFGDLKDVPTGLMPTLGPEEFDTDGFVFQAFRATVPPESYIEENDPDPRLNIKASSPDSSFELATPQLTDDIGKYYMVPNALLSELEAQGVEYEILESGQSAEKTGEGFLSPTEPAESNLEAYWRAPGLLLKEGLNITASNRLIKIISTPFDITKLGWDMVNPIADQIQPALVRTPISVASVVSDMTKPVQEKLSGLWEIFQRKVEPIWRVADLAPIRLPFFNVAEQYVNLQNEEQVIEECRRIMETGEPLPEECLEVTNRLGIFEVVNNAAKKQGEAYEVYNVGGRQVSAISDDEIVDDLIF